MRSLTSVGKRRGTHNLCVRFDIRQCEKAANLEDDDVKRMLDAVTFEDAIGDAVSVRRLQSCRLFEEKFESIPLEWVVAVVVLKS